MSYKTTLLDEQVASILSQGGVGVIPSDTIYGLSGLALNKSAVEKLNHLKNRHKSKPFIVLISNLDMLNKLSIINVNVDRITKYWPGPLSVIVDAAKSPNWLHRGQKTIALRIPNKPNLLDFIDKTGPIISTSVNLENQNPVNNISDAYELFGEKLDFYVDEGQIIGPASTIIRIDQNGYKIVRSGAIKLTK